MLFVLENACFGKVRIYFSIQIKIDTFSVTSFSFEGRSILHIKIKYIYVLSLLWENSNIYCKKCNFISNSSAKSNKLWITKLAEINTQTISFFDFALQRFFWCEIRGSAMKNHMKIRFSSCWCHTPHVRAPTFGLSYTPVKSWILKMVSLVLGHAFLLRVYQ